MRKTYQRNAQPLLFVVILLGGVVPVWAQQEDKRIVEIKRLYSQINAQIVESEAVAEGTGVYCNELVVNKGDKPWPAVGIYRTVYKFYYTYGDREKDPYPNRLLKITVTTSRSDRHEYAEYLFNPTSQLIFFYEKKDENPESERRYYFETERLIRHMVGQRIVAASPGPAKAALDEKKKLVGLFVNSLGD